MKRYQNRTPNPEPNPWENPPLPINSKAGVYARQSTLNQVKMNTTSTEMQTEDLIAFAIRLGWNEEDIILFTQDLARSGKLRIDQREGLRALVLRIEAGEIKAVIVFLEDRLFRDETQIQVNTFILICQEHNVLVITPHMTYNFHNPYHVKQFRWKCEQAADFLREFIKERLHGARDRVGMRGEYDGRAVPIGFIVDRRKEIIDNGYSVPNPTYKRFIVYEPHAKVVRWLFIRFMDCGGRVKRLYQELLTMPYVFPAFTPDVDKRTVNRCALTPVPGGYHISYTGLRFLLSNIAYIGWWIHKEGIKKDNHEALVPENHFWYAFNRISDYTPDGEVNPRDHYRPRYTQQEKPMPRALLKDIIETTDERKSVYTNTFFGELYYYLSFKDPHAHDAELFSIPTRIVDAAFREKLIPHMQDSDAFANFQEYAETLANEANEQCTSIATQIRVIDEQMHAALLSLTDPETPAVTRKALQTRYAQLDTQREELQQKLDTQKPFKRVQELLSYKEVLQRLAPQWEQLEFSDLKLLAEAAVEYITLDALSCHFCLFTIEWFDPTWGKEQAVLWRAYGRSPAWTDTELAIVADHYPTMPQEELLELLPKRSWKAIVKKAKESGARREHNQRHTIANLHITIEDLQVMQQYSLAASQISSQNHVIWLGTSLLPIDLPGQLP